MSHRHLATLAHSRVALLVAVGAALSTAQAQTTLTAPAHGTPPKRVNVLENGDFELLDELLAPDGWNSPRSTSFGFISDADDNHYVQLKALGEDGARRIFRRFELEPEWKTLRITARLKADGLKVGDKPWRDAHIVLTFYYGDGKPVKFTRPIALSAAGEWKPFAGQEAVPPGASLCEIEIANYAQAGTFAVDDVAIEPNGEAEAPLLRPGFPEGHFETLEPKLVGDKGAEQPAGWPIEGLPGVALEQEQGNHFLRFTNDDPGGHVRVETLWRLQPGTRSLKVSVRMRVRDLQMGKEPWQTARMGLTFTDRLGTDIAQRTPTPQIHADTEWATGAVECPVPPSARFLKIMPELMEARGVLDVDDIQVEQMP